MFQYEYDEKERIREKQAHEVEVEQVEGVNRKKCHRDDTRHTMALGVYPGVTVDHAFGFSDDDEPPGSDVTGVFPKLTVVLNESPRTEYI